MVAPEQGQASPCQVACVSRKDKGSRQDAQTQKWDRHGAELPPGGGLWQPCSPGRAGTTTGAQMNNQGPSPSPQALMAPAEHARERRIGRTWSAMVAD